MDQAHPKNQKNLISSQDMSATDIKRLFQIARIFSPEVKQGKTLPLLRGKTLVNLFFESSTRTRTSFELAIRKLEGSALNFVSIGSSLQKGETLIDTAKNLEAMGPHGLIVRHSSAGSPLILANSLKIPIINAGDGFHEHPTQGLLDAYTIQEKLGTLEKKRIVILGDIAHSRVARSNIHILKKLGASIAVCGPPSLLPPHPEALGVDFSFRPESLMPDADVVIALRVQLERQNRMQIPSLSEYSRFWGLSRERARLLKKEALLLHPGPVNRGIEIDSEVMEDPRSVILDQVFNGIVIRMAVLAELCNPFELAQWLEKRGQNV